MSAIGLAADVPADADEQTQFGALREHVIGSYRRPFNAVLVECLPSRLSKRDTEFATAQLIGPLLFNILVTGRPNDAEFCARVVDDFLAGQGEGRPGR